MAEFDLDNEAATYLTAGQVEALQSPKGFGRRARVAQMLAAFLVSVQANPDAIRERVSALETMSKKELKQLRQNLDDLERHLGKAGLKAPVISEELSSGEVSPETPETAAPQEFACDEPQKGSEEESASESAEEGEVSFTASAVVQKFVKEVLDIDLVEYDGTTAGRLMKEIERSGFIPESRKRAGKGKIDARHRLQVFFETNGSVAQLAQEEGITPGAVSQWFAQIRGHARHSRGEGSPAEADVIKESAPQEVIEHPDMLQAESAIEEEPKYCQIAEAWGEHLRLETDLKSALQELLNPNGSADVSTNKRTVATQFRRLLVREDGLVKTFESIDRKKLVKVWQLFGIGENTQNHRAIMRDIDPLGRRVAQARRGFNPNAAQDMTDLTYAGMSELLQVLKQQEAEALIKPKPLQVSIVGGKPVLVREP